MIATMRAREPEVDLADLPAGLMAMENRQTMARTVVVIEPVSLGAFAGGDAFRGTQPVRVT